MIVSDDALANLAHPLTLVDGCFDPLHAGHLAYFESAKAFGYPLLCHVASNGYVQRKHTPLLPLESRAAVIDGLFVVDYTHLENSLSTLGVLRQLKPTVYVKGIDWEGRLPLGYLTFCAKQGTEIRFTDTMLGSSTAFLQQSHDVALAQFEALALSQQTPGPWEPVTDYGYETRKAREGEHAALIFKWLIPCLDANVLDYGCGPGHLMRLLRDAAHGTQVTVRGYDPQTYPDAADWIWHTTADLPYGFRYDLVICREVLEHLTIQALARTVRLLCSLSSTYVYVTTRFHPSPSHLLDVATSDDLDPTHISMLSPHFLRALFVMEGFRRRADLEDNLDWKHLGRCLIYERAT